MMKKIDPLFWLVIRWFWMKLPFNIRKKIKWLHKQLELPLLRKQVMELNQIIKSEQRNKPLFIFAPSLMWNFELFQRPQQLALALASLGCLVFYIQPNLNKKLPPFRLLKPGLYLCNTSMRVFSQVKAPLLYVISWNAHYRFEFLDPIVVYDFIDVLDVFYGDKHQIYENHRLMVKEAQLVLATAKNLYNSVVQTRPDAKLCQNGVDINHFSQVQEGNLPCPADMEKIYLRGKPIIGYYGALAEWIDYDLLQEVMRLRSDFEFVFIGPDYDGSIRDKAFLSFPNVSWLGIKPYSDLPLYLARFNVAIIPFLVNDVTHAVSPLKLFEYMAGGKPIVITPMQESMQYSGVLIGRTAEEFSQKLDQALLLGKDPKYIEGLIKVARENTWEARAADILSWCNVN